MAEAREAGWEARDRLECAEPAPSGWEHGPDLLIQKLRKKKPPTPNLFSVFGGLVTCFCFCK